MLKVTETNPGVKGDTSSGGGKPALLETGATVRVPLFIQIGESIRVDTRTGDYVARGGVAVESGAWRPVAAPGVLRARAALLGQIRSFFQGAGVLEVETPACSRYAPTDSGHR